MPTYSLEIDIFGVYATNIPGFEIWVDGALLSSYSAAATGTSISTSFTTAGTIPTSLEFRFNDAFAAAGRTLEIRSIKINDKYANVGNYLSSDSLTKGQAALFNVVAAAPLFDESEPTLSEFTTGTTRSFTAGADTLRVLNSSTDEVFDALNGRDVIYTGSGNDKIFGNDSDDIIRSGAGNDLVSGGNGNDRIYGGEGDDTIYGGADNDRLHGEGGHDIMYGGAGNDFINGHDGTDTLVGGDGNDRLNGGADSDILFGGTGDDQLIGGDGNDTLDGGDGADVIYGGDGDDVINGGIGNDILVGNTGVDTIHGDTGDDTIYLMTNDFVAGEIIYGGAGTDELILSHALTVDFTTGIIDGLETLSGSDGDQDVTYTIEQALQFVTIDLNGGNDTSRVQISGTVNVTALGTPIVTDVENGFLTGSAGVDDLTISGAQLDALIFGAGTIDFAGGSDTLNLTSTSINLNTLGATDGSIIGLETIDASTAAAAVTIDVSGQAEGFIIMGSSQRDIILSGVGADIINTGDGNDSIVARGGLDIIDGGGGDDQFIYFGNSEFDIGESVTGGDGTDEIILFDGAGFSQAIDFTRGTISGVELLTGTAFDDDVTIEISNFAQFTSGVDLAGGTGDTIRVQIDGVYDAVTNGVPTVTNAENGFLLGSANNDTLTISGEGLDNLIYGTGTINFAGGTGDTLNLTSTSNELNILGSATNADVVGLENISAAMAGAGVVINLSAQSEDFNIIGSGFDDIITTFDGEDIINAGAGNDEIEAGAFSDVVNGEDGNDIISGGTGNDILNGGAGNDTIYGEDISNSNSSLQDDIITGGIGADTMFGNRGNDTFNLANGDFEAGESIDGGSIEQTIGDTLVLTNATTVNFTTGTLVNLERLTGSSGDDNITIYGATFNQFNIVDLAGGNDVINFTSAPTNLNGFSDGDLAGVEELNFSAVGARVTIDLSAQSENITITGTSTNNDVIISGSGDDVIYSNSVTSTMTSILNSTAEAKHIGDGWIVQTYTTIGTVTWTPDAAVTDVFYLVVGGGGAGGGRHGGGGGAGGVVTNWGGTAYAVTSSTNYTITVGDGGDPQNVDPTRQTVGENGDSSVFDAVTALGGGGGGSFTANNPVGGGSGGGGGGQNSNTAFRTGAVGEQTDSGGGTGFGNDGGNGAGPGASPTDFTAGGGGGGAGGAGSNAATNFAGGAGGIGLASDITGQSTYYAGGGGGGSDATPDVTFSAAGGLGGGGGGGIRGDAGFDGVDGLGGGGGGSRSGLPSGSTADQGGSGGSGTVIIRYQLSDDLFSILAGGTGNDQLYGDNGLDIFDFDHLGAANADTVFNFSISLDQIDLRDLLTSYDSLTELITDYVQITDFGANSEIRVDTSGAGLFGGDTLVATVNGVTGLTDEAALVTSGHLIV